MINSWWRVNPLPADNPVPKFTPRTPSNLSCRLRSCVWRSLAPVREKKEKKKGKHEKTIFFILSLDMFLVRFIPFQTHTRSYIISFAPTYGCGAYLFQPSACVSVFWIFALYAVEVCIGAEAEWVEAGYERKPLSEGVRESSPASGFQPIEHTCVWLETKNTYVHNVSVSTTSTRTRARISTQKGYIIVHTCR